VAQLEQYWQAWRWPAGTLAASIILALIAHYILFAFGKHLAKRTGNAIDDSLMRRAEGPTRWVFPLLAAVLVMPSLPVRPDLVQILRRVAGLGVTASLAWAAILLADVMGDALYAKYRIDIDDNLTARRIRTQIGVLRRIFTVIVVVIAAGVMLMTFPEIRQVGTSLLASAGLAGLVLGMAMKSTLSNLVAGLQIALTQPIRIEDIVIVDGEWGSIEEILTTYVVVRTWDLRRLVVPLSYFIDHVFQNWTRRTADLLAYVYIYCDYTVPVEELRQEFRRLIESSPLWDRKVCALQVSDASEHTIQIRALTSASDSSKAWDLRCHVREKLIQFLRENHPESLPKTRAEFRGSSEIGPGGGDTPSDRIRAHSLASGEGTNPV